MEEEHEGSAIVGLFFGFMLCLPFWILLCLVLFAVMK